MSLLPCVGGRSRLSAWWRDMGALAARCSLLRVFSDHQAFSSVTSYSNLVLHNHSLIEEYLLQPRAFGQRGWCERGRFHACKSFVIQSKPSPRRPMKRRNFFSGLLAAPLALKARLAQFFGRKPVELCSAPIWNRMVWARGPVRPNSNLASAHCSLPRGHKGPHVLLNPR